MRNGSFPACQKSVYSAALVTPQGYIHVQFIFVPHNICSLLLFMMLPLLQAEKWPSFVGGILPLWYLQFANSWFKKKWIYCSAKCSVCLTAWGFSTSSLAGFSVMQSMGEERLSERRRNKSALSERKIRAVVSNPKECKTKK